MAAPVPPAFSTTLTDATHAYNLAAFVAGVEPTSLLADLASFGPGRRLDDNASILLRYAEGAKASCGRARWR